MVPAKPPAVGSDARIRRWIERDLAAHPPRAPSLIVTLWGDAIVPHGGEVWLSSLFRLLAPFGINERLARTSVFRLARDGWLAAQSIGRRSRYRLTTEGTRRFAQAYRRVYAPPAQPWDGTWEIVLAPADAVSAPRRRALRDELAWEGFGTFGAGVLARPARVESALPTILDALDLGSAVTVFEGREMDKPHAHALADRTGAAWPLGELEADYRSFIARFTGVVDAFCDLDASERNPEQCFVVRTLIVHAYRRVRLRDPQLPQQLLPRGWPGAAAYALCRDFYRLARPLAEAHLAQVERAGGGRLDKALPQFGARFAAH